MTTRHPTLIRGLCQRAGELMLDPATGLNLLTRDAVGVSPGCSPSHRIDVTDDAGRVLASTADGGVSLYPVRRGDVLRTVRPGCPPHEQAIAHDGVVVELLLEGPIAKRLAEAVRTSPGSFGWTLRFHRVAGHLATTEESPVEAKGKHLGIVTGARVHTVILTTDSAKVDRGTRGQLWVI